MPDVREHVVVEPSQTDVSRRAGITGACVVFVLALVGAGWYLVSSSQEVVLSDWSERSAEVSPDGMHITLHYGGGDCGEETSEVRVIERDSQVELTVVTTTQLSLVGEDCPDNRVPRTIAATLDEPLGDRELVDGHCNHPEWGDSIACPKHR